MWSSEPSDSRPPSLINLGFALRLSRTPLTDFLRYAFCPETGGGALRRLVRDLEAWHLFGVTRFMRDTYPTTCTVLANGCERGQMEYAKLHAKSRRKKSPGQC